MCSLIKYFINFVFDAVGKSSFAKCKRLLQSGGVYISSDLGYMAQNIFLSLITPIIKPLIGNIRWKKLPKLIGMLQKGRKREMLL